MDMIGRKKGYRKQASGRRAVLQQDENAYNDGHLFDKIRQSVPDPVRDGPTVLMGSFVCQVLVMGFAFLAHHYRDSEFGCCNLWALLVSVFFFGLQWPYLGDWKSNLGTNPLWHRANIFAPYFIFDIITIMFMGGLLSMLAHAKGLAFFDFVFDELTTNELNQFVIFTFCFVLEVWLLIVLAHTHRNNLGLHYYAPSEQPHSATFLVDVPVEQDGSFNYRNLMGLMSRIAGCETSEEADANITRVVHLTTAIQGIFYFSIILALADEDRNRPGWSLLIGLMCTGMFLWWANYWRLTTFGDYRLSRMWNRQFIFLPLHHLWFMMGVYAFTVVTIFFQTSADRTLWDDIVPNLDSTEVTYFIFLIICLGMVFATQFALCNIHRKAWADGTSSLDDGVDYRKQVPSLTHKSGAVIDTGLEDVEEVYEAGDSRDDLNLRGSDGVRRKRGQGSKKRAERTNTSNLNVTGVDHKFTKTAGKDDSSDSSGSSGTDTESDD